MTAFQEVEQKRKIEEERNSVTPFPIMQEVSQTGPWDAAV